MGGYTGYITLVLNSNRLLDRLTNPNSYGDPGLLYYVTDKSLSSGLTLPETRIHSIY